jgi:hypothetical protein
MMRTTTARMVSVSTSYERIVVAKRTITALRAPHDGLAQKRSASSGLRL